MRKALPLLLCLLFLYSNRLFSQKKLLADSTYLSIQKIKNDSVRHFQATNYMVSLMMKKDPNGIVYSDMLLKDATASGNQKYLATVYLNTGAGYLRTGEYSLAYPNFLKALALFQKINEPLLMIRTYQNMAWIQIQLKDDGAESTIQSGLTVAKKHNLKGREAELYGVLGVAYDSHDQFDKAIAAYKSSLALGEKYGTKFSQVSGYLNLGISYRRSKRYDEALQSFLKAQTLATEVKDKYLFQSVYQNLAELTTAMKDYDGAEKYILLALANSKDNNEAVMRRGLFENMQRIYEKKGDYKKALAYADSVAVIDKNVFAKDKVATVRDLQTKYETAIKDQKILKQNAENQQQKQLLVIKEKQAQIQQLNFTNKQKQFETEGKLQASLLQKNILQARLDKQLSGAQIFKQNETIKTNHRLQEFLLAIIVAALAIIGLVFYNQHKTKQLNSVILSQKNDLESVNAVKDRMFGIIGHDMRAPINTLIAFNTLLESEELTGEQLKSYSGEIKKTLDGTSTMMNNLLNWASSQMQGYTPTFGLYNLKEITELVINTTNTQAAQKHIQIIDNTPGDVTVFADKNMTELVLRNLVTNAVKFTQKNGTITLNASQSAKQTTFSISDTGVGMPADMVNNLNAKKLDYNTKSTRGTNKEKGTGLGLVLCKTFVELMHGSITVESHPGAGSTFSVAVKSANT